MDKLVGLKVKVTDERSKRVGHVGVVTHVVEPTQPLVMVRFEDGGRRALSPMQFCLAVKAA